MARYVGITLVNVRPHSLKADMGKAGINGGLAVWNLFLAYAGALNAERVGRRPLWLTSTIGMLVSYIIITGIAVSLRHTRTATVCC